MVIFNELRIKDDRSGLVIDCQVEGLSAYSAMYIKSVELYYYKNTDSAGAPVDNAKVLTVYNNTTPDTTVKSIRKCVSLASIATGTLGVSEFKDGIFFVRITCDGTLGAEVSQYTCGADNPVDIVAVPDWRTMYELGMGLIYSLGGCSSRCDSHASYEQFILSWFEVRLAMSACDFDALATAWDRFLRIHTCSGVSAKAGCGCRG